MAQIQRRPTKTTTNALVRLGSVLNQWWWRQPSTQRRSYCATTSGLVALILLMGLLPSARHSWLALITLPFTLLFGWGTVLVLLLVLITSGMVVTETIIGKSILRALWIECAGVALFLLLTESRLLFGRPLGGALGTVGALLLHPLPPAAAQLAIVGCLFIDAIIAFRVSWREVHQISAIVRRPAPPQPVITPATRAPEVPRPVIQTRQRASHLEIPSFPTPAISKDTIERHAASGFTSTTEDVFDALRVPTYLRRTMGVPAVVTPAAATKMKPASAANDKFVLPPLALRREPDPIDLLESLLGADDEIVMPYERATQPVALTAHHVAWSLPPLSLLNASPESRATNALEHAERLATIIERTLKSFGVDAEVRRTDISVGPTIMRFGIRPTERIRTDDKGRAMVDANGDPIIVRTRVSRIMNLKDDLALVLEAKTIRMEAPVPERPFVGIEIPNVNGRMVTMRELLESREFAEASRRSKLAVVLGRDVAGRVRVGDLATFPHVLIAGATGAGKSVCLNAIIGSLITQATPDEVRLILIDPKMVELMLYDGIPHLLSPVVTDPKRVVVVLDAAIAEMEQRYRLFSRLGVRNLESYEQLRGQSLRGELEALPRIVIIIDELADLMLVAADDVERQICRLAQLARAVGIHLVVATQRPSVDVITGLIKANIPTRIAFMVSSGVDSRTILDGGGAEHLLGKGDMLFLASDAAKGERIQGAYVADDEVDRLARFWRTQCESVGVLPTQWNMTTIASDTHNRPVYAKR